MSKIVNGQFSRRPGPKPKPLKFDKDSEINVFGAAFINDAWLGQKVFLRRDDESSVKELITYVIRRVRELWVNPPPPKPGEEQQLFSQRRKKRILPQD